MVCLDEIEPPEPVTAEQLGCGPPQEAEIDLQVESVHRGGLAALFEPLTGELPDHIEDPEPRAPLLLHGEDQAVVDELFQAVDDIHLDAPPEKRLQLLEA